MWPSPVKAREWGSRNQQFNSAHPDHFFKGLLWMRINGRQIGSKKRNLYLIKHFGVEVVMQNLSGKGNVARFADISKELSIANLNKRSVA